MIQTAACLAVAKRRRVAAGVLAMQEHVEWVSHIDVVRRLVTGLLP
jgi:hypothetical protein